jgi:hypothetical protein
MSRAFPLLSFTALSLAVVATISSIGPAHAQKKEPPSCAAITFRPLPEGVTDGDQEAGLYKSRFGRVIVNGSVKGGRAETYFVTVNGKKLASAAAPATAASCATTKKLPAPTGSMDACLGERFQVMIDRQGDKRYVALYTRTATGWKFCSGGTA